MSDFIFERELENVKNVTIKEYLKEVVSSYNIGNYRSAIVSLYNIVLCDLVFKLKTLSDVYEDERAKAVLISLGHSNSDQNYSEWEKKLISEVVKNTNLLDAQDEQLIARLKEDRNHCAHLSLKVFTLFSPNKDQVRAHIRNMFEVVFLRESLLHKNIINNILQDIKIYYNTVGSIHPERYGNYLMSKYFSKLHEKVEIELFKTLWKFVFINTGEEYDKNRIACYYALHYLVSKNPQKFLEMFKRDSSFYCENIKINEGSFTYHNPYLGDIAHRNKFNSVDISFITSQQAFLIYFLSVYNDFVRELDEHVHEILKQESEKNINLLIRSIFFSSDFKSHITKIESYCHNVFYNEFTSHFFHDYYFRDVSIGLEQITFLSHEAEKRNCISSLVDFVLKWLDNIGSYDSTVVVMEKMIIPVLKYFNEQNVERLFYIILNNSQITGDTKNKHRYIPIIKQMITDKYGDKYQSELTKL